MNKKNIILNMFDILFLIIFSFIVILNFFYNKFNDKCNVFIIILITVIGLVGVFLLYKKIKEHEFKNIKFLKITLYCLIFIVQLLAMFFLRVNAKWDYGVILGAASDLSSSPFSGWNKEYFSMYTNNIPIMLLFRIVFYLFNIVGFTCTDFIAIMLNIIVIDVGIVILDKLAKEIFDEKISFFILIIVSLCSSIYLYVPIAYTDTLSFLFPQLIIYLYVITKKSDISIKKKNILCLCIGIVTFLGMLIKFTIIITLIGIILFEIILCLDNKKNIKNKLICLVIITASLLFLLVLKKIAFFLFINNKLEKEKEFPITHWIMMGLKNDGQYSEEDVIYTSSFETYDEKSSATKNEIIIRLKEHIKNRNVNFFVKKIIFVWGDGSYYSTNKLSRTPIKRYLIHEFVNDDGKYQKYYRYFSQSAHLVMLIFIVASSLFNKNDKNNINYVLRIIIFGIFIFFIMWEARSRYIFDYVGIMIFTFITGIENLYNKICNKILLLQNEGEDHI